MESKQQKTTSELLMEHLLKWQLESGETRTQREFATHIGENEKYLSMVMNGRKPSERQTIQFAEFFNDPRFYDAVIMDRPEPLLTYTKRNWGRLSEVDLQQAHRKASPVENLRL
jgi:hypothetical protein